MLAAILVAAALAGCLQGQDDPADDGPQPVPTPPPGDTRPAGGDEGSATQTQTPTDAPDDTGAWALQTFATGFDRPTLVTHTGHAAEGVYVLEQAGIVRIVRAGLVGTAADLTDRVGSGASEQGLLGLAFPPDFADRRVAFVSYTDGGGTSVLSRMDVEPDGSFDAESEVVLLTVEQPFANHNGGHIAFGPDGMLYVGLGDGGLAGDPRLNGQNPTTLLGSILRIDVSAGVSTYAVPDDNPFADDPLFADEVWAHGLRNPWRFSFDAKSGDLWIADVGQDAAEEVDHLPAAGPGKAPAGGANLGWNVYEGLLLFPAGLEIAVLEEQFVFPVHQYGHDLGCSITGGVVARGPAVPPALEGQYLFSDFCSGTLWGMEGPDAEPAVLMETGRNVSSFGVDAAGTVYMVDYSGALLRIVAA